MDDASLARHYHRQGRMEDAARCYRNALRLAPNDASLHHDHAVLLLQTGLETAGASALEKALAIEPNRAESLLALAACMRSLGRLQEGIATASQATETIPGDPLGWLLLGSMLMQAGASPTSAERALRRCIAIAPAMHEAWHYLGEALQAQSRWHEAAHAYSNARVAEPGELYNIASCAESAGDLLAARAGFRQMCSEFPQRVDCWIRLAHVAAQLCDFESEKHALAAMQEMSSQTDANLPPVEPFPLSYLPVGDGFRRRELARYAARQRTRGDHRPSRRPVSNGPLRIGYLSPDFGAHAVGELLSHHFAAHDRDVVSVFGYSLRRHDDETATRIQAGFDTFHHCEGLTDDVIARQIQDDRIEVLIDLAGFTDGARPGVLAMRPAAIQLGWLGFIHGHQAPWLDALLLDGHLLPDGASWPYDDKVIRLPGTMLPAAPVATGMRDRAAFRLPEDVVLLASFNNSYKLDEPLVEAWTKVLGRARDAHLLVVLPDAAQSFFLAAWRRHGGDTDRLHIQGRLPMHAHANRVASCDLVLDSFRYQGGATSIHAISQGVPVLSRQGSTPLSRLGTSLNHFLGLPELACPGTQAYVESAIRLANDRGMLDALRRTLAQRVEEHGLMDPRRAAGNIEQACLGLSSGRSGPVIPAM